MVNQAVARRYARALFDLASEKGLIDQMDRELGMLVSMIESNRQLSAVMNDVLILPEVKTGLIKKILDGKVSPLLMNFVLLVIRKRREAFMPQIYRAFLDLANEARGIVEVEVRSATELSSETLNSLEARLNAKLGKRVKFQSQVVPELVGGLVIRVGDELMDGSVKTRLSRMKDRLIRAKAD